MLITPGTQTVELGIEKDKSVMNVTHFRDTFRRLRENPDYYDPVAKSWKSNTDEDGVFMLLSIGLCAREILPASQYEDVKTEMSDEIDSALAFANQFSAYFIPEALMYFVDEDPTYAKALLLEYGDEIVDGYWAMTLTRERDDTITISASIASQFALAITLHKLGRLDEAEQLVEKMRSVPELKNSDDGNWTSSFSYHVDSSTYSALGSGSYSMESNLLEGVYEVLGGNAALAVKILEDSMNSSLYEKETDTWYRKQENLTYQSGMELKGPSITQKMLALLLEYKLAQKGYFVGENSKVTLGYRPKFLKI